MSDRAGLANMSEWMDGWTAGGVNEWGCMRDITLGNDDNGHMRWMMHDELCVLG